MDAERNDYTHPIEDRVQYEKFSKEFLLKLMKLWQYHWEAFQTYLIKLGREMEGIGPEKTIQLQARVLETVTPAIMEKIAELATVDVNTVEGRCKAGTLGIDTLWEKYPNHWEVKSDNEVHLSFDRCAVIEENKVHNIRELHLVCKDMEPRYAAAYMNYPNAQRKVKVTMLKVPESTTEPVLGEPLCVWKLVFEG